MKEEKEEKIVIKTKKNKKGITKWMVLVVLVVTMLSTLCFSTQMELFLHLRPNLSVLASQDVELHFIDVGQGDAIAIRFVSGETMLIDAGPKSHKNILFTYLNNVFFHNQQKHFDYVLLTHSDNDHCGNLLDILKTYTVGSFYRPNIGTMEEKDKFEVVTSQKEYAEIITYTKEHTIPTKLSVLGSKVIIGGTTLSFIGPVNTYDTTNAQSTILYLEHNGYTSLLVGDAEYPQVRDALEQSSFIQKIDILKIGHHGSANSLVDTQIEDHYTTIFDKIQVKNAVISVSKYNTYGHPSPVTLTALKNVPVTMQQTLYDRTHLTANEGNILATLSNELVFHAMGKTNDYVYIPYYAIVLIVVSICTFTTIIPKKVYRKYRQSKNQKI